MNREELRAKATPKTTRVNIPEWDTEVRIRQFSASQIVNANQSEDEKTIMARGAIACLVDDAGSPIYSDCPDDIAEILGFSFAGLIQLNKAITDFNALNKPIEELAKN